jgi:hypothetical protein
VTFRQELIQSAWFAIILLGSPETYGFKFDAAESTLASSITSVAAAVRDTEALPYMSSATADKAA